jgi:hypothetical protein
MSNDSLLGKGALQIAREERANHMRRLAWELVTARGTGGEGLLEYRNTGLTIQYSFYSKTNRLSVSTKAGQVLVAHWGNDGKVRILNYAPGLWETRLKHLTRGAL